MTVFAHLIDNELQGVYDLLPKEWNGISSFDTRCLANPNFMYENGFSKIVRDKTPFNPETHKMSDFPWYTVENGKVIEHRDILELSVSSSEQATE